MSFAIRRAAPQVLLVLLVLARPAAAERAWNVAVRGALSQGYMLESLTAYPELDIVGSYKIGARGYVALAGGLAPFDDHTYLADGRDFRLQLTGGATVYQRLRAAGTLGLESITFHADPDVLADHPGVDILATRYNLIPSLGIELSYPIGASTIVGAYTRTGLRELELYDTPQGAIGSARFTLVGAFVELQLR